MSHAYAITNLLSGLAATAFTWSSGYTTGRDKLNDGLQDELAAGSSTAQASGQTLVINLGSAQAVSAIALLNHNLATGSCTVKVEAADDAAITVNAVTAKAASTITTTAPNHKDTVLQFPSATKQYWRLTFVHTGTKIVTLGELLMVAAPTTLSRRRIWGHGESERFVLNHAETSTGNTRSTFLSGPIRTKRLPFKDLRGTSERDELMGMWRSSKGGCLKVLWIDTVESQATAATADGMECLWGKLQDALGWTEDDYSLYTLEGALELVGAGREAGS